MKEKPITPYQRLLAHAQKFARAVEFPKRRHMWTYPADKLDTGWALNKLHERAVAAEQLGFVIELKPTDKGLEVWYVAKRPERPVEFG